MYERETFREYLDRLRSRDGVQLAMAGINAGVVGILPAAWVGPEFTSRVHTDGALLLALACFGLLLFARLSPVWVVGLAALAASIIAG